MALHRIRTESHQGTDAYELGVVGKVMWYIAGIWETLIAKFEVQIHQRPLASDVDGVEPQDYYIRVRLQ